MTYQEFLAKLRETPRTWRLTRYDCIRSGVCCPITALAQPRRRNANHYADVAVDIGLASMVRPQGFALTHEIIDAADKNQAYSRRRRRDLLAACGLPEDA